MIINTNDCSGQADYVLEQAGSGEWTYRKWKSGIAECWASKSFNINVNNAYGNVYYGSLWNGLTLPAGLFVDAPILELKANDDNADCWIVNRGADSVNIGSASLLGPTSRQRYGTVSLYCIGRWK